MYQHCTILHLEDSDDDSLFVQTVLKRAQFNGCYRRVSSTTDALAYLQGGGDYADRALFPAPQLFVCDSSVEGEHTLAAVVQWFLAAPTYRDAAVVFLTGAMTPTDLAGWLTRGVRMVLEKGHSLDDLGERIHEILRQCPPPEASDL